MWEIVLDTEHKGVPFVVVSGPWGHNGYIRLPPGHAGNMPPGTPNDYSEDVVDCIPKIHGGPTYRGRKPFDHGGVSGPDTWIGFDTNHHFDTPATQTLSYVRQECIRFIDALLSE